MSTSASKLNPSSPLNIFIGNVIGVRPIICNCPDPKCPGVLGFTLHYQDRDVSLTSSENGIFRIVETGIPTC